MAIEVIALRADYGYVCFVLFLAILIHHFYMAFGVTKARKKCESLLFDCMSSMQSQIGFRHG